MSSKYSSNNTLGDIPCSGCWFFPWSTTCACGYGWFFLWIDPRLWFWRGFHRMMMGYAFFFVDDKGWYLSMKIDELVSWRYSFFLWSQTEATDSKSLVEEHSKSATVDLINWSLRSPKPYACIKPQAEEGIDLSQSSGMIAISLALSQLFQWQ